MNRHYISYFIGTLLLIFLQAVVLNHLRVFAYFMPVLYLYPLLKLPYETPKWVNVLLGALTGIVMDLLMNTPGLNMASGALTGYLRRPLLSAFLSEEALEESEGALVPESRVMKFFPYFFYLLTLTAIHVSTLFLLEGFSIGIFTLILPYILGSIVFTVLLCLLFDLFARRKRD